MFPNYIFENTHIKILLLLGSIILTSCGGTTDTDPTDTASWSSWSQWLPASTTDTNVMIIDQSRTRNCSVSVNGTVDSPAPSCIGSSSETRSITNTAYIDAVSDSTGTTTTDPTDTATWVLGQWTPANNADTNILAVDQTRNSSCVVTVIGVADNKAPICTGDAPSATRTIDNPLAASADTATWVWSAWTPTNNADTNMLTVVQSRSSSCVVTVIGVADDPAPSCAGDTPTSTTRTIDNPLAAAADTATWVLGQWTPANNADTNMLTVDQTSNSSCVVTVIGVADNPAPSCTGNTPASETRVIDNPLAASADTTTWVWSQWTPTNNTDTSVLSFAQTRTSSCIVTVNGVADNPAPICTGDTPTSQAQTIDNPLAASADTATWTWSQWTPTNNTDTNVLSFAQTRTSSCIVTVNGVADNPAPTCSGNTPTSATKIIDNSLAASVDTAAWVWSPWTPANNANTSILTVKQNRTSSCVVTVKGVADDPAPTCTGSTLTSKIRVIDNQLAAAAVDTATWVWGAWTPSNSNPNSSIIYIDQTRTSICKVTVNGVADEPAATCGNTPTSQTRSVTNVFAVPDADYPTLPINISAQITVNSSTPKWFLADIPATYQTEAPGELYLSVHTTGVLNSQGEIYDYAKNLSDILGALVTDDDTGVGENFSLIHQVAAGTKYLIRVDAGAVIGSTYTITADVLYKVGGFLFSAKNMSVVEGEANQYKMRLFEQPGNTAVVHIDAGPYLKVNEVVNAEHTNYTYPSNNDSGWWVTGGFSTPLFFRHTRVPFTTDNWAIPRTVKFQTTTR